MEKDFSLKISALIWDLDGTLLDSYGVIVSGLYKTCMELGIPADEQEILREVITHSVGAFISKTEKETGISSGIIKQRQSEISDSEKLNIMPIRHAAEILSLMEKRGIRNFVFTHRGTSTDIILKNTGLYEFFEEIITGKDGFPRKPDPAAVLYLIRKYDLDKEKTFYVGDRTLDVECAVNAGIGSILYLPENSAAMPDGKETYIVKDLLEIGDIIS